MRGAPVHPDRYEGEHLNTDEKLEAEGWAAGLRVWEQMGKAYEQYLSYGNVDSAVGNAQMWSLREAIRAELLAELFPEPGTNPLAQCAPDRESPALRNLRGVLLQAEHAETALRESPTVAVDPEREEILTAVTSVRRLLTPWATRGWVSRYDGR